MEKAMCYAAIGVAAIMAIIFMLDMVLGTPFGGSAFIGVDIFGFLASAVVVYLGVNALRDVK